MNRENIAEQSFTEQEERAYLQAHMDVAYAVALGRIDSGWEHFRRYGEQEGRPRPKSGASDETQKGLLGSSLSHKREEWVRNGAAQRALGRWFRNRLPVSDFIFDLKLYNPAWRDIYSPVYEDGLITSFIHSPFLDDTDAYIERHQDLNRMREYLEQIRPYITNKNMPKKATILDLGSGAGHSVFPLLDMFPQAIVTATDLSIPLLVSLRNLSEQMDKNAKNYKNRLHILQANTESLPFFANTFHLIVGGSILHHLLNPSKAVAEASRVLKPGGIACFIEPFEAGAQILCSVFRHILAIAPQYSGTPFELPPKKLQALRFFIDDVAVRVTQKNSKVWNMMDDKHLFTREFWDDVTSQNGLKILKIHQLPKSKHFCCECLETVLELPSTKIPDVFLVPAREADATFSDAMQKELILNAFVVLQKEPVS